ncbi:MAG: hypothetical protein KC466_09685, partial [Myxococcales bacterium]|nr:hypothetical protein [Myxococcales bacterium]
EAVRHFSPGVATAYITGGELILDIALLRSLDDFVDDEMSHQAMALINRDESRHIAMDYHMTEYYCSEAYREEVKSEPAKSLAERTKAAAAFAEMLYHARPFFMDVFFRPMELVDPSNKRLFEAFKRMQMLALKPEVARTPFAKLMSGIRDAYKKPAVRKALGPVLLRVIGLDEKVMVDLYSGDDKRRARELSFDEMAQEALGAKYQ